MDFYTGSSYRYGAFSKYYESGKEREIIGLKKNMFRWILGVGYNLKKVIFRAEYAFALTDFHDFRYPIGGYWPSISKRRDMLSLKVGYSF